MVSFELFHTFLPAHNPIGFGAADFVELAWAAVLVAVIFAGTRIRPFFQALEARPRVCLVVIGLLPLVLRFALLSRYGVPEPQVSDDFSYLLSADTLRHFHLANPTHAYFPFFETFFVLQQPSYSSIFPIGQGLTIALGWMLFGHPWAGVVLSVCAFAAACYWMLRGWVSPGWALAGGMLAAVQFGPLSQWMNSYWGGAVSATAGCLVFGALPRLRGGYRPWIAAVLGCGIALQLLTRPFEALFLVASALIFLVASRRDLWRIARIATLLVALALGLIAAHNVAVTGSWHTLPYMVSRYQYGVPATFTFQANPVPRRELTREQKLDYDVQSAVHGDGKETVHTFLERLASRVRFYRFFFFAPLYLALPFFLWRLHEPRYVWVAVTLALFAVGTNVYPYFYPHYVAAVTCLLVLTAVAGMERLSQWNTTGARIILLLAVAHFVFWYSLHLVNSDLLQYQTWVDVNKADTSGRARIVQDLQRTPGEHVVFVKYAERHAFDEWVHNGADIDSSRIVWARDRGEAENGKLRSYYRNRLAWMVEPDNLPVLLRRLP